MKTDNFSRNLELYRKPVADAGVERLVWQPALSEQMWGILSAAQGDKNDPICFAEASEARQIPLAAHCPGPY